MKHSRQCEELFWDNKWHIKMNNKPPRYFCDNCDHMFYTGKFCRNDPEMYDDVCPYCGCYPTLTFEELVKEYIELRNENYLRDR